MDISLTSVAVINLPSSSREGSNGRFENALRTLKSTIVTASIHIKNELIFSNTTI